MKVIMWKHIIIFLAFTAVCYCQSGSVIVHKKKPIYYHDSFSSLLYGGGILYYLTFILIKIKVAFVVGTILTIFLVAGKLYAIIKYADYLKNDKAKAPEPEKIYIPSSSYDHHGPPISYSSQGNAAPYFSDQPSFSDQSSFPTDNTVVTEGQYYNAPPGQYYNAPPGHTYGRNFDDKINYHTLNNYYDLFLQIMRKLNTTKTAFNKMKLNSTECRRKFVCEIEYNFKHNKIFLSTLSFIRDEEFDKYGDSNVAINSWTDCDNLYQNCMQGYT